MKKLFTFVSKVHTWWISQSILPFILSANLIAYVLGTPLILLLINLDEESIGGPELEKYGLWGAFLAVVVVAPLLETLLGQSWPIRLLQRWYPRDRFWLPLVASTLLFSAMHITYSVWYAVVILPIGTVLSYTYLLYQERKGSSYWVTAGVHAVRNLIALGVGLLVDGKL
jgi:hypothetical protein